MAHQMRLEVVGTGSYLPPEVVPNSIFTNNPLNVYDETGAIVATKTLTEEGIFGTTGIRERRRSEISPAKMGYLASLKALESAGMEATGLVGIVLASVTESNFASGAAKIQLDLNARNVKNTFDINNACAGLPKAIEIANSLCADYPGNYLVVASEKLTSITDYTDINSTLFGDGAGAVVLSPTSGNKGVVARYSKSDPFEGNLRLIFRDENDFLKMPNGSRVLRKAVNEMVESARSLKSDAGWEKADVYIPHQANGRILDAVERELAGEGSTLFRNIDRYGNMSAATCAVGLDEAVRQGLIVPGKKVIVTSFGAGLVTSGVAIQF